VEHWPAPRAHLDGERLDLDLRPYQVANQLAFQLGRRVPRFGRARFPRFFLGMGAAREPLDPNSGPGARDARRALITSRLRNRPEGRNWLRESAQAIAGVAGLSGPVTDAVGLAVDGVVEVIRTISLLRGAGMRWYQDGLGFRTPDPADALVELSVQEFLGNHEWVDDVLCRAFVADLRGEFDGGVTLYARRTDALVLLDNVGTPPARRFLTMLSEQPDGSGPLLVVAASHQRFPSAAAARPADWQPDPLAEASTERWSARRAARGESRYYPVWVDPIDDVPPTAGPTRPEVREAAKRRELRAAQFPAVAFAHRLTAAHPSGLEMVFDTLQRAGGIPGHGDAPAQFDLRRVLGMEYRNGFSLDDAVFDLVLGPWANEIRRGLVLMAMAVDLSDASIAPILNSENQLIAKLITEFRANDLWVAHTVTDGVAQPPRMHPFALRAIAHRLGREGGIAELDLRWDQAHELLRISAATRDDQRAVLYHETALRRLAPVATRLTEMFDPVDPRRWYELLLQVTAAPAARPDRASDARSHWAELAADPAPETVVTRRLVAALQLHTDPLGDPTHEMCTIVARELGELAGHADAGTAFLLARSSEFEGCWKRWHSRWGEA
jgi:hypothetical protein